MNNPIIFFRGTMLVKNKIKQNQNELKINFVLWKIQGIIQKGIISSGVWSQIYLVTKSKI